MGNLLNAQTYEYTTVSIAGLTDLETIKKITRPDVTVEVKKIKGTQNKETRRTSSNTSISDITIEMGKDEFNRLRETLTGGTWANHLADFPFNIVCEINPPNAMPQAAERVTFTGIRITKFKVTDMTGENDYTATLTCTVDDYVEEPL